MKVQIFTLRYDRNKEQFDDTKLNEFVATGIDVIDVREHFFSCDGTPVWALLVSYRETADVFAATPSTLERRRSEGRL